MAVLKAGEMYGIYVEGARHHWRSGGQGVAYCFKTLL